MKNVIVTTTINPPTEAIRKFEALEDWDLVVIGDLETPKDYRLGRGVYLDPEAQERYDKDLSDAIGWNCIQRRNFGLLVAHDMKADVVAVVDDDNIPLAGWGENLMVGKEVEVNYYETDLPAFDPIGATNHAQLWHRGYPLQLLSKRDYSGKTKSACMSTSRPISGTATPTSTPCAAWSTRRNAISTPRRSPLPPTGSRPSIHRTPSSPAVCSRIISSTPMSGAWTTSGPPIMSRPWAIA
jgi:hypothetical protein